MSTRLIQWVVIGICLAALRSVHAAPHFPGDRPIDVEHIRLDLNVDVEHELVRGRATIRGVARRALPSVTLDAVDFSDVEVSVGNDSQELEPVQHEYDDKQLVVTFSRPLERGDRVEIVISYTLKSPSDGLNFFGPTDQLPDAPYQMWSQGQSTSNRYWVPCFDHPNEMQTTEIVCTVAKPYIAISNGALVGVTENDDDTRTFHWKMSKPHVAYLMALVVGEFASKTEDWRGIPVSYYVREKFESMIDVTFGNTTKMLDHFNDRIGVDYPWEKYAQVCCHKFGGGMENTSCTILGESTLHDERAHLDRTSDGLIAHELAHQWFGDLVTCNEWAHLWLNEGFASYFEALWDEHDQGADAYSMNMLQKAGYAMDGGKDHPVVYREYKSEGEQFDSRAYSKGAWILHMIRRRLGDEVFWKAVKAYVTKHAHQTVDTADFRSVIEDVSGEDFARFFYDWTERPGHPIVKIDYSWSPDDTAATVELKQTQKGEAFHFPLTMTFGFDGDESAVTIRRDVTEKKMSIHVPLVARPTSVLVDPDQAVLMDLTVEKPMYLWQTQLTVGNAALRLRAAKALAADATDSSLALLGERLKVDPNWEVQAGIAELLGEDKSDEAKAFLLGAMGMEDSRVLSAVIGALGEFGEDEEITKAVSTIVEHGHRSYKVEAEAIETLSTACFPNDKRAVRLFETCLSRDSHREVVREAAFEALAEHGDESAFELVKANTTVDHSAEIRAAAAEALGKFAARETATDDQVAAALEVAKTMLNQESTTLLIAGIHTAEAMGKRAADLADLIATRIDDKRRWVSRAARKAAESVKKADADETNVLRERVTELEADNETLRKRIEELEAAVERNKASGGVSSGKENVPALAD